MVWCERCWSNPVQREAGHRAENWRWTLGAGDSQKSCRKVEFFSPSTHPSCTEPKDVRHFLVLLIFPSNIHSKWDDFRYGLCLSLLWTYQSQTGSVLQRKKVYLYVFFLWEGASILRLDDGSPHSYGMTGWCIADLPSLWYSRNWGKDRRALSYRMAITGSRVEYTFYASSLPWSVKAITLDNASRTRNPHCSDWIRVCSHRSDLLCVRRFLSGWY